MAVAACGGAKPGDPALPPGFADRGVPPVELNAYVYADLDYAVSVEVAAFGGPADALPFAVRRAEGAVAAPDTEQAARFELDAAWQAEAAVSWLDEQSGAWAMADGLVLAVASEPGAWADEMAAGWSLERRETVESRYPEAWEALRLLPEAPPGEPLAAGFVRNAAAVADDLAALTRADAPDLKQALGLARIDTIAFVVYAERPGALRDGATPDSLREARVGAIAVAKSRYPALIIGSLTNRFAAQLGLEEAEVAGERAWRRSLQGRAHLVVKTYGAAFYFAVAPTAEGAEALVASVIRSQEARA
ncbi:MAG: hypothetical protein J4F32_01655 [Dehalococcoidia bacterium]|nr:hypothetical protein [Dehalococcoidia bacterium]